MSSALERSPNRRLVVSLLVAWFMAVALPASAQSPADGGQSAPVSAEAAKTVFDHPASSRLWVSGQINVIGQGHPEFPAAYSGPNSLKSTAEFAVSNVLTLYTGYRLNSRTEVFLDIESAGGKGISSALGVAGFTNLDVVRNPTLGQAPYLSRFMVRRVVDLGGGTDKVERGPFNLADRLPVRRLEFRVGKMSVVDFFDLNGVGSDSHLQFLNWTLDNNGAYDYAANTRGYTWAAIAEFHDRRWGVRFGEALMPKVANGTFIDANLARAHAENLELELRPALLPGRQGTIRLLSFMNHANMGKYRLAIDDFRAGLVSVPDITATRQQGRVKYGFGVNLEQEVAEGWRVFGRWGWNDGRNESFAYTEVDRTIAFGSDFRGDRWHRPLDKLGGAFVSNAISGDHRIYLELGGQGFLLGDGGLNYGREKIIEAYYNCHLWRGFYISPAIQHINNPGYNRDRGPALVPSVRVHVEL